MIDKKQLKFEYKNRKFNAGVFMLQNKNNKKAYISSCVDLEKALNKYEKKWIIGSHPNKEFVADFAENGLDDFEMIVIEKVEIENISIEDLMSELKALKLGWKKKLSAKGVLFYN